MESGGIEARPPVAWFSAEWGDCQDNDLVFTDNVHDGELELAGKDPAASELVREASIRKLSDQSFGLLHGFVKPPAQAWADCREVRNLVKELFAGIVDVADGSHR